MIARIGPWPVNSRLIVFRDRVWFVNSVKGVDHNSADLYSLDAGTGELRYERHLWSQDAGQPLADGGLLYWPSEDPRVAGWGDFQVTNGEDWKTGQIPTAQIFHVHAIVRRAGQLVAATSAWRAGLQISHDAGRNWQMAYDHETPPRRVSRIVSLAANHRRVVGEIKDPAGRRLIRFDDSGIAAVPGWPSDRAMSRPVHFKGAFYGLIHDSGGTAVWRTDGSTSRRIRPAAIDWRPFALAAGNGMLWALTGNGQGGMVWRSTDGVDWTAVARLEGGAPFDLAIMRGRPFVGGRGADGRGVLWGRATRHTGDAPPPVAALPALKRPRTVGDADTAGVLRQLDRLLADPSAYDGTARRLRDAVHAVVGTGVPPGAFERRLDAALPDGTLRPFRDVVVTSRAAMGRFWLLWGIGLAGQGRVPPDLIAAPWTAPENGAAKYFESQIAAMWAVVELDQADRETIDALIARLRADADPLWLKGDAVGALTALTGRRLGYDLDAWTAWWASARKTWVR